VVGWAFDAEIIHIAERAGLKIHQEPVVWRDDHRSKVRVAWACASSFGELIRIWWNGILGRYK
jgi:hypothetical protein